MVMDWHDDILMEVLKRVDAKSLGISGCVSKQWRQISELESVWEEVCIHHCPVLIHSHETRRVVLALGGYRRLYSLFLRRVIYSRSAAAAAAADADKENAADVVDSDGWSSDQVQLSLSLFSISCYERMAKLADSTSSNFIFLNSNPITS